MCIWIHSKCTNVMKFVFLCCCCWTLVWVVPAGPLRAWLSVKTLIKPLSHSQGSCGHSFDIWPVSNRLLSSIPPPQNTCQLHSRHSAEFRNILALGLEVVESFVPLKQLCVHVVTQLWNLHEEQLKSPDVQRVKPAHICIVSCFARASD